MPSMTLTCCVCNLPMQRSRTSRPQGEAKHGSCRPAHGGHGAYKKGCRCDVCKAGQASRMREYVARKKLEDGITPTAKLRRLRRDASLGAPPPCFICKEPLKMTPRGTRRPMHKTCRASAPNWLRYDLPSPKVEAFRRKIQKAARGTSGNRVFTCGGCQWCDKPFVGIGVYCSKACSTSSKFARRSSGQSFNISPRKRQEIYERDGWVCQLCNFPVERGLHYIDDWAPSLDHIVPRSTTLVPDHSPSNLQLAHRMCNSMKGDGSNMTEAVFQQRIADHFEAVAA